MGVSPFNAGTMVCIFIPATAGHVQALLVRASFIITLDEAVTANIWARPAEMPGLLAKRRAIPDFRAFVTIAAAHGNTMQLIRNY